MKIRRTSLKRRTPFWLILVALALLTGSLYLILTLLQNRYLTDMEQHSNLMRHRSEGIRSTLPELYEKYIHLEEGFAGAVDRSVALAGVVEKEYDISEDTNLTSIFIASYIESLSVVVDSVLSDIEKGDLDLKAFPLRLPIEKGVAYSFGRGFGPCTDPFTGAVANHQGLDIIAYRGSPVVAPASGIVVAVQRNHRFWGDRVTVAHGPNIRTVYAHLDDISVARGQRLSIGDQIGTVGESGLTTGVHLHYEIHLNGEPVDPFRFLVYP